MKTIITAILLIFASELYGQDNVAYYTPNPQIYVAPTPSVVYTTYQTPQYHFVYGMVPYIVYKPVIVEERKGLFGCKSVVTYHQSIEWIYQPIYNFRIY